MIQELRRVLRDKLGVPLDTIEAAEAFLRAEGVVAGRAEPLGIEFNDPDDVPVLEAAVAENADVLVTGDRDLLEIADDVPVAIVTPRGLWEALTSVT